MHPNPKEWLTKDAAYTLADKIRLYWAARGFKVNAVSGSTIEFGEVQAPHGTVYCVRSNMRGGLPPVQVDAPIYTPPIQTRRLAPSHPDVRE